MTPEEHYQRGLALLEEAEQRRERGLEHGAQTDTIVAQGHFSAATAGAALKLYEATAHPRMIVTPADDVAPGGTDG